MPSYVLARSFHTLTHTWNPNQPSLLFSKPGDLRWASSLEDLVLWTVIQLFVVCFFQCLIHMVGWWFWFGTFLFFHILGIYNHPNCYSLHHFSEGQPPTRHVHPNPNMVKEVIAPRTTQKPSGFMAALPQGKICRKGAEKRGWSTMVSVEDLASKKAMEQHHGAHRNLVSHVLLGEVNCLSIDMGESTQSTPHHPFFVKMGYRVAPKQHSFFHPEAVMCGTEQQLLCSKGASFAAPFRVVGSVHLCRKIDLQNWDWRWKCWQWWEWWQWTCNWRLWIKDDERDDHHDADNHDKVEED